jgi:hypothetical protein
MKLGIALDIETPNLHHLTPFTWLGAALLSDMVLR